MQQWIDLARFTGLQARKSGEVSVETPDASTCAALDCKREEVSLQTPDASSSAALDCQVLEDTNVNDESSKQ